MKQQNQPVCTGATLSPRLRKVIQAIATGRPVKQLADELGLTYNTFRSYRQQAFAAIGCHSTAEAIIWWNQYGINQNGKI